MTGGTRFRYWLAVGAAPARLVSVGEYVAAERAAGLRNRYGRDDEPAGWRFSGRDVSGWVEYATGMGDDSGD